jgi:hypothetical protein
MPAAAPRDHGEFAPMGVAHDGRHLVVRVGCDRRAWDEAVHREFGQPLYRQNRVGLHHGPQPVDKWRSIDHEAASYT